MIRFSIKRFFIWLSISIGCVLMLILTGLWFLLATSTGAGFVLKQGLASQEITAQWERIEGTLISGLLFEELLIQLDAAEIRVSRFESHWDLKGLISGTLSIEELLIAQLDIKLGQVSEAPDTEETVQAMVWPSIELPIDIEFGLLQITSLSVTSSQSDTDASATDPLLDLSLIQLGFSASGSVLVINELILERAQQEHAAANNQQPDILPTGRMNLATEVELIPPYTMNLDMGWQIALELPEETIDLVGDLVFSGDIANLYLTHQLSSPIDLSTSLLLDTAFDPSVVAFDIDAMRLEIENSWAFNSYRLPVLEYLLSSTGQIDVTGMLSSLTINSEIQADIEESPTVPQLAEIPAQNLVFNARVQDLERMEIEQLQLSSEIADIATKGSLFWSPYIGWDIDLIASDINPQHEVLTSTLEQVNSDIVGLVEALFVEFHTIGSLDGENKMIRVDNIHIDGRLRGYDVQGKGALAYENDLMIADQLLLYLGDNQLEINARLNLDELLSTRLTGTAGSQTESPIDLRWAIQLKDMQQISPEIKGTLYSTGSALGGLYEPNLDMEIQAESLEFAGNAIEKINATAGYESGQKQQISLQLSGIQLTNQPVMDFSLNLNGNIQQHQYELGLVREDVSLDLAGNGALQNENQNQNPSQPSAPAALIFSEPVQWQTDFSRFDIGGASLGDWRMQPGSNKPGLLLAKDQIRLDNFCLLSEPSEICAQIRFLNQIGSGSNASSNPAAETNLTLQASINQFNLDRLQQFLPENTELAGDLNLSANLTTDTNATDLINAVTGSIDIGTSPIRLTVFSENVSVSEPDSSIEATDNRHTRQSQVFQFTDTRFLGEVDAGVLDLSLESRIADTGLINGRVNFPFSQLDPKQRSISELSGQIQINFDALDWLDPFLPQISDLNGKTRIDLSINGNLDAPVIRGDLAVSELVADIPDAGIRLEQGYLNLDNDRENYWNIDGKLNSGEGNLGISGDFLLNELPNWQARLKIQGDQFFAYSTDSISVYISPDLDIEMDSARLSVKGEVQVPKADIEIKSLPPSSVSVSRDEIIVGVDDLDSGAGMATYIDLSLKLGDDVFFNGFDLKGRLSGQVRARENPNQTLRLDGSMEIIDGTYQAYGQDLKINPGRFIFSGAPDNPNLNIRAYRELDDYTVGIQIGGTPEALSSTLYSTPAQSSTDTLAMLVTGKPLSGATSGEGLDIANAVATFGIARSGGITQRLQSTFGLDELSIGTEDDVEQTAVTIGKYLSPTIFISYVQELLNPISSVSLDYRPTEKIRINATSGNDQSMDIFYRIERD